MSTEQESFDWNEDYQRAVVDVPDGVDADEVEAAINGLTADAADDDADEDEDGGEEDTPGRRRFKRGKGL